MEARTLYKQANTLRIRFKFAEIFYLLIMKLCGVLRNVESDAAEV